MSSVRELRSCQPNVTRSASKNSYVARTTLINHDRLSRDDSPARKTNKKAVRKPSSVERSSKLATADTSVKSPSTSRDASTESRRSVRSREASEDRKSAPVVPSAPEVIPTKKKVGRKKKAPSPKSLLRSNKHLVSAEGSASSSISVQQKAVARSKLNKGASASRSKYLSLKKKQLRSKKPIRGKNGRFAYRPRHKHQTYDALQRQSRQRTAHKVTLAPNCRKSGRLKSPSPAKGPSGDAKTVADVDNTDSNSQCNPRTKQQSDSANCEQLKQSSSNVPSDKVYESDQKPRTTRKRAVTADIVPIAKTHTVLKSGLAVKNINRDKKIIKNQKQYIFKGKDKIRKKRGQMSISNAKVSSAMDKPMAVIKDLPTNTIAVQCDLDATSLSEEHEKQPCSPTQLKKQTVKQKSETKTTATVVRKLQSQVTGTQYQVRGHSGSDPKHISTQLSGEAPITREYEVREKKSLNRELTNLSFSNPGKVVAASLDISKGTLNERGKYLRLHSNISYFSKKNLKTPAERKSGVKSENSSISRLRLWKEKRASLKRRTLQCNPTDYEPSEKKRKVNQQSLIPAAENSICGILNIKKQDMKHSPPVVSTTTVSQSLSYQTAQEGVPEKRKRGRPRKVKSMEKPLGDLYVAPVDTSIVTINEEVVVTTDLNKTNPNLVLTDPSVLKKKKRKRRTYKGCLDASFKYKKKSSKPTTGTSQSLEIAMKTKAVNKVDTSVDVEEYAKPHPSLPSKPTHRSDKVEFGESFTDDNLHEEHSYAKSSHTESVLQVSPQQCTRDETLALEDQGEESWILDHEHSSTRTSASEDSFPLPSDEVDIADKSLSNEYERNSFSFKPAKQYSARNRCNTGQDSVKSIASQENILAASNSGKLLSQTEANAYCGKSNQSPSSECVMNSEKCHADINLLQIANVDVSTMTDLDCLESEDLPDTTSVATVDKQPVIEVKVTDITPVCVNKVEVDINPSTLSEQCSSVESTNKVETVPEILKHVDYHSFPTKVEDPGSSSIETNTEPLKMKATAKLDTGGLSSELNAICVEPEGSSGQITESKLLAISEYGTEEALHNDEDSSTGDKLTERANCDGEDLPEPDITYTDVIPTASSPLTVEVDDWEDSEAPPMLTPVKTTLPLIISLQDGEHSPERNSPPILLASDSCLPPLADNYLTPPKTTHSQAVGHLKVASLMPESLSSPVNAEEPTADMKEILFTKSVDQETKRNDLLCRDHGEDVNEMNTLHTEMVATLDSESTNMQDGATDSQAPPESVVQKESVEPETGLDFELASTQAENSATQVESDSGQFNSQEENHDTQSLTDSSDEILQDRIIQPSAEVSPQTGEESEDKQLDPVPDPTCVQEDTTNTHPVLAPIPTGLQQEITDSQPSSSFHLTVLHQVSKDTHTGPLLDPTGFQQETTETEHIVSAELEGSEDVEPSEADLRQETTGTQHRSSPDHFSLQEDNTHPEIVSVPCEIRVQTESIDIQSIPDPKKLSDISTHPESSLMSLSTITDQESQSNQTDHICSSSSMVENAVPQAEAAIQQQPPVPFKRPRGRPRKIKGRKFKGEKSSETPSVKSSPKARICTEKESTPKQTVSVKRTFALRPQISRSPLENIALRFGGEEAYSSLKKKSRASINPLHVPPMGETDKTSVEAWNIPADPLTIYELKRQCKPCSVVLTDFVKQLNLDSIESSDDSDSGDSDYSDIHSMKEGLYNHQSQPTEETSSELVSRHTGGALQQMKKAGPSRNTSVSKDSEQDILATEILEMFANYKCKYCDYSSESSQLMEDHVYIHKDFFKFYPVSCLNCPKRFPDRASFGDHHLSHHPLQEPKCEEIDSIVEKDHYQIVLCDGSTIDLKMPDTAEGYVYQLGDQNDSPAPETLLEKKLPEELRAVSGQEMPTEVRIVPTENLTVGMENENVFQTASNEFPTAVGCDSIQWAFDEDVVRTMQTILDELENFGETALGYTSENPTPNIEEIEQEFVSVEQLAEAKEQCSEKLLCAEECKETDSVENKTITELTSMTPVKPASPITVLLSKDGITESADEQTSDESETPVDVDQTIMFDKNPTAEDAALVEAIDKDKEKVDPVVEKLRRIVRSVPQTKGTSSKTTEQTSSNESCSSSVLVQAEQGGKKESSVIDTSTSSAPVIISFLVSGNVEVTTPDAQAAVARIGSTPISSNKFTCTYCMHGSDDRSRMVEHVAQIHHDDNQFTCCLCDKAFSSNMSVISQHIRAYHPGHDEHKMCKPLPGFYAVDELREHNSVRTKTSDNIFEMFSGATDDSSLTSGKDEPIRQHFRKARDVMHYREKAKRQAEADSTTSGTGEETESIPSSYQSSCRHTQSTATSAVVRESSNTFADGSSAEGNDGETVTTDQSTTAEEKSQPPTSTAVVDEDTNTVSSSEKRTSISSETREFAPCSPTTPDGEDQEDESNTEEDPSLQTEQSQYEVTNDDMAESEGDSMLKIVSVVSLQGVESSAKTDVQPELSNKDSGEITREAAQSAVSALFKKTSKQSVYSDPNCKHCSENLSSMQDLYCHLQNMHKLTCFYSCPLCLRYYRYTEEGVRQHMSSVHATADCSIPVQVVSENCPETKSTESLTPCSVNEISESVASYHSHMQTVPSSTGLQCKHCPSNQSSAGALLKHLESVHGENCLLVCPYCKKAISKDEADVYDHIGTQHKNYDSFVPLLLVSNRAAPSSKQSLTISESRRQLFANKTRQASNVPISDKTPRNDDNVSTQSNSYEADLDKCKSISMVSSGSAETTFTASQSPVLSPLALLKQTTSSILEQGVSEAASVQRPTDTTVSTFSTVFSIRPAPAVKRNVPILPKPDGQPSSPVFRQRPPVSQTPPIKASNISVNLHSSSVHDSRERPRPIVPRGIKHVEKRPVKDLAMLSQMTSWPLESQQNSSYRPASVQPELSHIPPVQPATAIATTVTRSLLRIPSIITSSAGKFQHPRPTSASGTIGFSGSSTSQGQAKASFVAFGASSPHSAVHGSSPKPAVSPTPPTPAADTPLDLSCSSGVRGNTVPEDDIDPDAFNVFNLCPAKKTESDTQPLNLSVKVSLSSEQSVMHGGYGESMFPRTPSNTTGCSTNTMSGSPASTPSANVYATPPGNIPVAALRQQMGSLQASGYSHQSQMNPRHPGNSGIRHSTAFPGVHSPHMMQSGYRVRQRNMLGVQRHILPQSRPVMRQQIQGRMMMHGDMSAQRQSPRHSHRLACPSCDFYTVTPAAMKAHITNVHKARYRCPYCPHLVPLTQRDVTYHISQQHPGKNVMYYNI